MFNCTEIEDEIHFICKCILYRTEREELFTFVQSKYAYFELLDDCHKFIFLFSNGDSKVLSNLGKFIHNSFIKRSECMKLLQT